MLSPLIVYPSLCQLISGFLSKISIFSVVEGATSFPCWHNGVKEDSVLSPLFSYFSLIFAAALLIYPFTLHSYINFKSVLYFAFSVISSFQVFGFCGFGKGFQTRYLNLVKFYSLKTQLFFFKKIFL